jgi:hypothetical protein
MGGILTAPDRRHYNQWFLLHVELPKELVLMIVDYWHTPPVPHLVEQLIGYERSCDRMRKTTEMLRKRLAEIRLSNRSRTLIVQTGAQPA